MEAMKVSASLRTSASLLSLGRPFGKLHEIKTCPWCGESPPLASMNRFGTYTVGCESDECAVNPQVTGKTLSEAWAAWNRRTP
jgi:hypothetical protein